MKKGIVAIVCLLITTIVSAQKGPLDRSKIPQPVFEKETGMVDMYWKTWELAWDHVKHQEGLIQTPYMDEAFDDEVIWIWDTEFMVLFCKYSPELFPGVESLNNFYGPLLDRTPSPISIHHVDNPPFFAWAEAGNFKFTNDMEHLNNLMLETKYLQRHFEWVEEFQPPNDFSFKSCCPGKLTKRPLGYYWGDVESGMDNTPRADERPEDLLWIDALAQQALSAKKIVELSKIVGDKETAKKFQKLYEDKKELINTYYWDEEDGFYYDIYETDTSLVKVPTPASYWVMLAGVPSPEQAKRMAEKAADPEFFGGDYPWPTVARNHPTFNGEFGDYWRGSIWLPTAYMSTKALEEYEYHDIANENAENLLNVMLETYRTYEPSTIWECYNPTMPKPAQRVKFGNRVVRPDFCGWSALGPISLFIENVLGFYDIDAASNTVKWNLHQEGKHGIKQLTFGNVTTDIVADKGYVQVESNEPYTLIINGKKYKVKAGSQKLKLK